MKVRRTLGWPQPQTDLSNEHLVSFFRTRTLRDGGATIESDLRAVRSEDAILSEIEAPDAGAPRPTRLAAPPLPLVAQLFLLGAATAFLYERVLRSLAVQWWTDENYSHGFLIPLIAAYLVWERRQQLGRSRAETSPWGYPVLLLGLMLLIVGQAATFGYSVRLSFLVTITGLTLLLAGPAVLRIVAFPLVYLLFMIPLPATLLTRVAFPLQLLAARLATGALDLINVPVLREGNIIDLAATRLEVTEACSGIRSLISLLALAVIFAYVTQRTWRGRLILALSAVPIAVVANAARVTLTGVLAHAFGPAAAMGFYHLFSGWVIFVVAFALMVAVGRMMSAPSAAAAEGTRA